MSTFTNVRELGSSLQKYNMEVFKEPRGVTRILQFVFALINAIVLRTYEGYIDIEYCSKIKPLEVRLPFEYPFNLNSVTAKTSCNGTFVVSLQNDFSSEAEFLFNICWVSVIYVLIIGVIYIMYREEYESSGNLALVDFGVSVILAVLWIACLGAWGYGQSQLKNLTHPDFLRTNLDVCNKESPNYIDCLTITRGSVVGLTESFILSFLNFFIWAAGLWFLYKETPWYLQFQRA